MAPSDPHGIATSRGRDLAFSAIELALLNHVHWVVHTCLGKPFVGAPFGLRLPDIEPYSQRTQGSPQAVGHARYTEG